MSVRHVAWMVLLGFWLGVAVEAYQPTLGEALALMWVCVGIEVARRCWKTR